MKKVLGELKPGVHQCLTITFTQQSMLVTSEDQKLFVLYINQYLSYILCVRDKVGQTQDPSILQFFDF